MSRNRRTLRHPLPIIALTVAIAGLAASTAAAQSYWFEDYQRAVVMVDRGQHQEAAELLEPIMSEHPFPIACMRIPGDRCIDYVPYFQRARIQFAMGDTKGASHSLDIEAAFGAVLRNRRNEKAFIVLRTLVDEQIAATANSQPSTVVPAARPK